MDTSEGVVVMVGVLLPVVGVVVVVVIVVVVVGGDVVGGKLQFSGTKTKRKLFS